MRVSLIQMEIKEGDKESNFLHALHLIEKAVKLGTDFIVLPELWMIGYNCFDKWVEVAEPIDGPIMTTLREKARKHSVYIHTGSFVEKRGESLFNTCTLIDSSGSIIAKYSKIHLFPYGSNEPKLVKAGDECAVVDTKFGKIGLAICYDIRFPEFFRLMTDMGAEIFVVCFGWHLTTRLMHYPIMVKARAIDNQAYMLTCNAAGGRHDAPYFGWSMVVNPLGQIVASGKIGEEDIVRAEIDIGLVKKLRKMFPYIYDSKYKVCRRC